MRINNVAPMLGDFSLHAIGSSIMDAARSGVGLFKDIRGDAGNTVVEGAAPVNYANLAVYGTLAALALLIVVKAPTRRTR